MTSLFAAIVLAPPIVNIKDFGGTPDGKTDISASLQAAYDALPETGGVIQIPAGRLPYIIRAENPTCFKPKIGLKITKPNVFVRGINGRPSIKMVGVTLDEMNAQEDFERSGRDWFSVISFVLTTGGGVKNLSIVGEWDGTGRYRYGAPRAKGISVIGSADVEVMNIKGRGIFGNTLCAVAANSRMEGKFRWAERLRASSISASLCTENGVNYMGGTRQCILSDSILWANGSTGAEAGGENNVLQRLTAYGNGYAGVSLSQQGTSIRDSKIYGNGNLDRPDAGMGIILNGKGLRVTNTSVYGNSHYGIYVYPNSEDVEINGATLSANSGGENASAITEICVSPGSKNIRVLNSTITAGFPQVKVKGNSTYTGEVWRVTLSKGLPNNPTQIVGTVVRINGRTKATGTVTAYDNKKRTLDFRVTSGEMPRGDVEVIVGSRSKSSVFTMKGAESKVEGTNQKGFGG